MDFLFYFLAILILFHESLSLIGVSRIRKVSYAGLTIIQGCAMIGFVIWALIIGEWMWMVIPFGITRFIVIGEITVKSLAFRQKTMLPLIPGNLLVIVGAIFSSIFEILLIFGISYLMFWGLTLFKGRKMFSKSPGMPL